MVVPAPARDLLDLAEGQEVLVSVEGGKVVMQPVRGDKGTRVRRPKYTLDQLVAGMETEPAAPTERDWIDAPPAGRETW
jgi:AbrB family looped-hinge helix DNA binding protein